MIIAEEVYLEHFGVKGMKWGVRNEKNSLSKSHSNRNKAGSSKDEDLFVALTSVAVILGTYGAIGINALKESGALHSSVVKGKSFVLGRNKNHWKKKSELANPDADVDFIMSKVVKHINPNYGARGTKMNCRRATLAYEMRRRGYDVAATLTTNASGQTAEGLSKALFLKKKDQRITSVLGKNLISGNSDAIFKSLSSNPDRSRGEIVVGYKFGGAHSMAWENIKGKPIIFDAQNGKKYESSLAFANDFNAGYLSGAGFTRLDNAQLNNAFLTRWLKDA